VTVILVGVVIATVTDVELNFIGTVVALAGAVVTSLYQILVGTKQKELQCDAMQLLYFQAPISAVVLIFAAPFFDDMSALRAYEWNAAAIRDIFLSSMLSFGVNVSIYGIIGRTSPVTYNIVGHVKTVCVLIMGFVVFKSPLLLKNIIGITLTVGKNRLSTKDLDFSLFTPVLSSTATGRDGLFANQGESLVRT
jgi:solute carrier family 35 protein E3